jgi:polyhydroxybutyrate depolymerase
MVRRPASLLRSISIALALVAAPAAAQQRIELPHDGLTRAALLDARPGLRDAPLLIALHGGIAGPDFVRRRARVDLWRRGWAVVWPEAVEDWNDGRRDRSGELYNTTDDVSFLRALVAALAAEGMVDPERVYVAGPSIGGMMTLRMVCDAPDLVKGAAVAIAALPVGLDCDRDGPPVPLLFIHGTEDAIVPPGGGRIGGDSIFIRDRGSVRPIDKTLAFFADRNRCGASETTPLPDRAPDDGTTATLRVWTDCAAALRHVAVRGGGHTWPGSRPFRLGSTLIGATSQDFRATDLVQEFLLQLDAARADASPDGSG